MIESTRCKWLNQQDYIIENLDVVRCEKCWGDWWVTALAPLVEWRHTFDWLAWPYGIFAAKPGHLAVDICTNVMFWLWRNNREDQVIVRHICPESPSKPSISSTMAESSTDGGWNSTKDAQFDLPTTSDEFAYLMTSCPHILMTSWMTVWMTSFTFSGPLRKWFNWHVESLCPGRTLIACRLTYFK